MTPARHSGTRHGRRCRRVMVAALPAGGAARRTLRPTSAIHGRTQSRAVGRRKPRASDARTQRTRCTHARTHARMRLCCRRVRDSTPNASNYLVGRTQPPASRGVAETARSTRRVPRGVAVRLLLVHCGHSARRHQRRACDSPLNAAVGPSRSAASLSGNGSLDTSSSSCSSRDHDLPNSAAASALPAGPAAVAAGEHRQEVAPRDATGPEVSAAVRAAIPRVTAVRLLPVRGSCSLLTSSSSSIGRSVFVSEIVVQLIDDIRRRGPVR